MFSEIIILKIWVNTNTIDSIDTFTSQTPNDSMLHSASYLMLNKQEL